MSYFSNKGKNKLFLYNLIPLLLPGYRQRESCIANFINRGTIRLLNYHNYRSNTLLRIHSKKGSLCINKWTLLQTRQPTWEVRNTGICIPTCLWWLVWPTAKCLNVYLQNSLAELFCDKISPVVNCWWATVAPNIIQYFSFNTKKNPKQTKPHRCFWFSFSFLLS